MAALVVFLAVSGQVAALEYPPLTDAQRTALETAYDGRDYREEAFFSLLENAKGFDGKVGDAMIRVSPDLEAMVANPAAYRGDLCRVEGAIQQQTPLAGAYKGVDEWFIRDRDGRPFVVYLGGDKADRTGFSDGERVEIVARFYKRMDFTARDGVQRIYAAFVGAKPMLPGKSGAGSSGAARLWMVAIPVTVLFGVFLVLWLYARRARGTGGGRRRMPTAGAGPEVDEGTPLPDDPAEALAELRQRADAAGDASDHHPA